MSAQVGSTPRALGIVRMTAAVRTRLEEVVFRRYPNREWATFFRFGFRSCGDRLVITVSDLLEPEGGDLDGSVGHVRIEEPYSLRAGQAVARGPLLVGVVHSHPEEYRPIASTIDDDMDAYFAEYFGSFASGPACFVSLICSRDREGAVSLAGRAHFNGAWLEIDEFVTVGEHEIRRESSFDRGTVEPPNPFTARLESVYGRAAAARLARAKVGIVGCSGTGSPAAHVLARAGVGALVLVDPQRVDPSNHERVHGLSAGHFSNKPYPFKVQVVGALAKSIAPNIDVIPIAGSILDPRVRDELVQCDIVLGCTDRAHPRVAVSELAYRYLLPALDVGVLPEGRGGAVRSEWVQVVAYRPEGPCAYCVGEVDSWRVSSELMTDAERQERRAAAADARARGDAEAGYWRDEPQLHTVGHLTTMAGALVAGYAIGWLTGAFELPAPYFQLDILAKDFGYRRQVIDRRPGCACTCVVGHADQGAARAIITAPEHLEPARIVSLESAIGP